MRTRNLVIVYIALIWILLIALLGCENNLHKENKELEDKVKSYAAKIGDLSKQNEDLYKENEDLYKENEDLRKQNDKLRETVSSLEGMQLLQEPRKEISPNVSVLWNDFISLSGSGSRKTETFWLSNSEIGAKGFNEWCVIWNYFGSNVLSDRFHILLYEANTDRLIGVIASTAKEARNASYFSQSGEFYLEIHTSGKWKVSVQISIYTYMPKFRSAH